MDKVGQISSEFMNVFFENSNVLFNNLPVFLAVRGGSDGVFMLVVPVGSLSNISVDLEWVSFESVLGWFDLEVDISGAVEDIKEFNLEGTVVILEVENQEVFLRLDWFNGSLNEARFSWGNLFWDVFEMGWALVTDMVEFLSEFSIIACCSKFNDFLFLFSEVFVDTW